MASPLPKLKNNPIVEAVLDVDCDLPPGFDLVNLQKPAQELFLVEYPKFHERLAQQYGIERPPSGAPNLSAGRVVMQSIQFRTEDEKQIVQVRAGGFSFNRLAPYTILDDYLPEIQRTWRLYVGLVSPVQIRAIRLRYINRILVPLAANKVDLDEFFKISPRSPDEERFLMSGFLSQQSAVEKDTGLQVNLVLATGELPVDENLPVILDITVASPAIIAEPSDWSKMRPPIDALRRLKNHIFQNSLTPKCLKLFQ